MKQRYHVFLAPAGCGETYLGDANGLREARSMASRHAKGQTYGLDEALYETARAAGHCNGISAPPPVGEPISWFGAGGNYCACLEVTVAECGCALNNCGCGGKRYCNCDPATCPCDECEV